MDIINNSISLDTIGGGLSALSRQFLTFGGVNEYGEIPAWTATGDFEVEFEVNADFATNKTYLGQGVSAVDFIRTTSATSLDIRSTASGQRTVTLSPGLTSNKSQVLRLVRTAANLVDVYIDDILNGTSTAFAGDFSLDVVGQKGGGDYFNGVIANLRLTDTAGGDNRFYPMSGGRSGSGAYELDKLATLGAELWAAGNAANIGAAIAPTATGFDGTGNTSDTVDYSGAVSGIGLSNGDQVIVEFDLISSTGSFQAGLSSTSCFGASAFADRFITGDGHKQIVLLVDNDSQPLRFGFNASGGEVTNITVRKTENAMTLNNLVSTDWEKFTQVGDDWLGGELVVNGGFDTDTDWTKGTNVTISGGNLVMSATPAGFVAFHDLASYVAGHTYQTRFDHDVDAFVLPLVAGTSGPSVSGSGSYSENITVASSGARTQVNANNTATGTFDNVSVKRILEAP